MHISIFLTCVQAAEDKRFAQLAVPESALASRCSLGFFDRCTSSSFVELDRCIRLVHLYSYHDSSSPQKAGFSGTPLFCCIVHRMRSAMTLTPRNASLGSNLHALQKQHPIRKRVWDVAGGGQEIRNTPETFHLVPPSVKKSGFKPFLHIHLSSAFTAFHQNKGHIKDTESSSSTAAVTRQRLFFINQVFKKLISTVTRRMAFA